MEEIGAEIDNVREAWRWSIERGKVDEISKLLHGLWFFYEIRGLSQEAVDAFGQAASALESEGGEEGALSKDRAILVGRLLGARGGVETRWLASRRGWVIL